MADVKWIKVATDIFDNRKIAQIEAMPEGDALLVIWIKILCLAGSINDRGQIYLTQEIPYTEQMLATQFRRNLPTVQLALRTFEAFGMIEVEDDILRVSNWERYQNVEGMEKIRAQNRARVQKHREKKRLEALEDKENVTGCNVTDRYNVTFRNGIEVEEEKEKESTTTTTGAVFVLTNETIYTPPAEKLAEWKRAFPDIDVEQAVLEAAVKNNAQTPAKRKNELTVEPYIVNWLIIANGDAKKKPKKSGKRTFSNGVERPAESQNELLKSLEGRNGNLI